MNCDINTISVIVAYPFLSMITAGVFVLILFCNTDGIMYSGLTRHVNFVRHSDLSDGDACFDEIFRK